MTPPLVDPATAREQLRNADAEWLAVLRSFDAFEVRLERSQCVFLILRKFDCA